MAASTRQILLHRALSADTWLTSHTGRGLRNADQKSIGDYLLTLPPEQRDSAREELIAFGDDLVRKGVTLYNPARSVSTARKNKRA